jgi:hypothetical protein
MTGDDDPISGEVKAAVSLMMRRVAKEDAKSGAWRKFICGSGSEVRTTGTTKDTKVIVRWKNAVEGELWCDEP